MIKVISYNILSDRYCCYKQDDIKTHHLLKRYEFVSPELLLWENRLPKIISIIKNYDIICLQEVDLIYINDIVDLLPGYQYCSHILYKEGQDKSIYKRTNPIGNITLWKNINCIDGKFNSCAVFTKFSILSNDFLLINVHLKGGRDFERERINQLKACLKNTDNKTIICGDFNDQFENELTKLLNGFTLYPNQLTCCCYQSFTKTQNYHSFDHVVSKQLTITQHPTDIMEPIPNETNPSDHLPIKFDIIF